MTPPSRLPTRKDSPAHARNVSDTLSYASSSRNGSISSASSVLPPSPSKASFGSSGSTLPSIRSLRNKFQSLSGGGKKGRIASGPKVISGPSSVEATPPPQETKPRGLTRTFGSYNLGNTRRTSNLESPALSLASPPHRRPSLDSALSQSPPPTRMPFPLTSRSPPPAVPPKSTVRPAGLYSRSPAETPLSQLRATRQPSLLRKPNPGLSKIPTPGTIEGAGKIPPPRSVFSPTAQLMEPHLTFAEALEPSPAPALSVTQEEQKRFKDDFAFRRNSINKGVEEERKERRASGLVEVATVSQPKENEWLAGLGVQTAEEKKLADKPATVAEKDVGSALSQPILLADSPATFLRADSFLVPLPPITYDLQRQASTSTTFISGWTSSPDPVAIAVFSEIPEPTDGILTVPLSTAPTTPERRRRTTGEPETPDGYGTVKSPDAAQLSPPLQQDSHRRSASSSSDSSAPHHLDRPISSNSHLSGHTFGPPHSSPTIEGIPFIAPPSPSLAINTTALDPVDAPFDPHRRSRSALDSVLSYGDPQINRAGTIEPSSPVYVLSTDAFAGLYRSSSARTGAMTKEVRARKVRSWEVGGEEEVLTPTARRFAEAGRRGMGIEGVSSPLEDLIVGLGGRRHSVSSLGTRRGSIGAREEERTVKPELEGSTEPLAVEEEDEVDDEELTTGQAEFDAGSPAVKLTMPHDKQLSVDEMEHEVARMESELAVAIPATSPVRQSTFDTSSLSGSPIFERSSLFPIPSSLERCASLSSSMTDITPRTARRWSMHEVELAYQRMKDMLGSSRGYAISEAGTFADDREMDDGEVEGAFERALRDASIGDLSFASESSAVEEGLADDGDRATPMLR